MVPRSIDSIDNLIHIIIRNMKTLVKTVADVVGVVSNQSNRPSSCPFIRRLSITSLAAQHRHEIANYYIILSCRLPYLVCIGIVYKLN